MKLIKIQQIFFLFLCGLLFPLSGKAIHDNSHLPEKPFNRAIRSLQKDIISFINKRYTYLVYTPELSAPTNTFLSYGFMANIVAPIGQAEARELIVETMEYLLHRINRDPTLRKYMEKEQFDYSDIFVSFTFHSKEGAIRTAPHLSRAYTWKKNLIVYDKIYFTEEPLPLCEVAEEWSESYEEAKQIVQQSKKVLQK